MPTPLREVEGPSLGPPPRAPSTIHQGHDAPSLEKANGRAQHKGPVRTVTVSIPTTRGRAISVPFTNAAPAVMATRP